MKYVLKWTVPADDQAHLIGSGKVVHVACQGHPSEVQVWTEEVEGWVNETRSVRVYGTGQTFPDSGVVLGTTALTGLGLVWHVVETRG